MWCPIRGRGAFRLTPFAVIPVVAGCDRLPVVSLLGVRPVSDVARDVSSLLSLTTEWILAGMVVVEVALLVALIRFRKRPGEEGVPAQTRGGRTVHVLWATLALLPIAWVATPALRTARSMEASSREGSLRIDVVARQWWWQVEYPGEGVVTANEIHMPVDQPVEIRLRSDDVAHGLSVPGLGARQDLVPGRTGSLRFTADRIGEYRGSCVSLCGASHANMRLTVFVESEEDYRTWVRAQSQGAATGADDPGFDTFVEVGCATCHEVGVTAAPEDRVPGPDLTHVASRRWLIGGLLPNTPENLRRWITDADTVMPGQARVAHGMPGYGQLPERQIDALVAFLRRLE